MQSMSSLFIHLLTLAEPTRADHPRPSFLQPSHPPDEGIQAAGSSPASQPCSRPSPFSSTKSREISFLGSDVKFGDVAAAELVPHLACD